MATLPDFNMVTEYTAEFTYSDKDEHEFNVWLTFSETIEKDLNYEQRELLSIDDYKAVSRGRTLNTEENSDVWQKVKEAVGCRDVYDIQEVDYN